MDGFEEKQGRVVAGEILEWTYSAVGGPPALAAASKSHDGTHVVTYAESPDGGQTFAVRYREDHDDPFEAGKDYAFFYHSLGGLPGCVCGPGEGAREGRKTTGARVKNREVYGIFDDLSEAEERLRGDPSGEERVFLKAAVRKLKGAIAGMVPDEGEREVRRGIALGRRRARREG